MNELRGLYARMHSFGNGYDVEIGRILSELSEHCGNLIFVADEHGVYNILCRYNSLQSVFIVCLNKRNGLFRAALHLSYQFIKVFNRHNITSPIVFLHIITLYWPAIQ